MPAMNFITRRSLFTLLWMVAGIIVVRHAQMQYIQTNGSLPHPAKGTTRLSIARKSLSATTVQADEWARPSEPPTAEGGGEFEREMRGLVLGGLGGIALAFVGMKAPGMAGPMMMKSMHRIEATAVRIIARAPAIQVNVAELGLPTAAIAAVTAARLPAGVLEVSNRRGKEKLENLALTPLPLSAPKPHSAIALQTDSVQKKVVETEAEEEFFTELVIGNVYESMCDASKWWKIKVTGMNASGSYFGTVENATATPWNEIWPENCRSVVTEDVAQTSSLKAEAVEHMMEKAVEEVVMSKTAANTSIVLPKKEFKEIDWDGVENKTYGKIAWMMA